LPTEKRRLPGSSAASANRELTAAMLAGLLLLTGIYAYLYFRLYSGYLLVLDDPGNIGGTVEEGLRGWLTRGMANYYHVYPEWPQSAFSNFYRPVWNLIIFAEQAILGQHYWAWFLAFCALQYGGTLLFVRLLQSLGMPARSALPFAILFLFNPAFLNFGFIYPGFQFDVFVSLLLLLALYQLLHYRYGSTLALITTAIFTKETAIFAPVAAAITVFILKRDAKWSVAMLIPLLAWIAARWLAFHAVMGGTFASPTGIGDILANVGEGFAIWPSSAAPANFLLQMKGVYGVGLLALLTINAVLWAILVYAGVQIARAPWQAPDKAESKLQAVLLVWTLGALAYCMLTRPQVRFGASLDTFLLLFLAYFMYTQSWPKYLKTLPVLILAFVAATRGVNFLWSDIPKVLAGRSGEAALFSALHSLPQDGRAVFVVNAPTMLSAPRFVAKEWNLKLDITFINQFRGCSHANSRDAWYELSLTALSVEIPSCAFYVFAGVPRDIQAKELSGGLLRPGVGIYQFPGHPDLSKRLSSGDIDFGRAMQVQSLHFPGTMLVYDWQTSVYRTLETETSSHGPQALRGY
jgi:hypothetical protein